MVVEPFQYRAAENAAMEHVNGPLLPSHITSERYEPTDAFKVHNGVYLG